MDSQERPTRIIAWTSLIVVALLFLVGAGAQLTGHSSLSVILFEIIEIIVGMLFLISGLFLDTWFGRNLMGLQAGKGNFNRYLFIICGFIMVMTGILFLTNRF
ncbi:MAG TPA: hypothetical protein VFA41_04055 [Ktedonobacteraceae bacterium]|nr:hypothetical protein [Ktedonobacteraceae bacterium]